MFKMMLRTVNAMLIIAAAAVLLAYNVFPVVRVYGNAMSPAVEEGDILILKKGAELENGEIAAFCYGNKILVRRCIAGPGDLVDADEAGNLYVNGDPVEDCSGPDPGENPAGDVTYPVQVPEECFFFVGDNRAASTDSRHAQVGMVKKADVLGKLLLKI